MIKHTPGPWRYDRRNPSPTTGEHMIAGGKPGYLAEVRDCGSGDIVGNARLIAAAPDLLAALQDIVDAYQKHFDAMPVAWQTYDNIARQAIEKATGN
jgi:hypothetical protein